MELIEIIPNVSEGRRTPDIDELAGTLSETAGVWLLDVHRNPSHNRSVLTAVGKPEALREAAHRLAERGAALIDLRHHRGEHPRIGALDVLPFVPLFGASRTRTIALARGVAEELGQSLELPVFLYGEAALREPPRPLSELRRGGLERLSARIAAGELVPDFGPDRLHPTAGALAVGVRDFLIAFNVNLRTQKVGVARAIARKVRASSGGLPGVQALGMSLAHEGLVQVSMNVTDFRTSSLGTVFEAVRREAGALGVAIDRSEIVGLIPAEAAFSGMEAELRLRGPPGILEERLEAAGLRPPPAT